MPTPSLSFELSVQGMTCASCVGRVEKALRAVPGVTDVTVNLATERATVDTDAATSDAALQDAIRRAGYEARVLAGDAPAEPLSRSGEPLWPVLLAAALSLPLVLPMLGMLFGADWMLGGGWQLALATPVQFWLGARFYRAGWRALRGLRLAAWVLGRSALVVPPSAPGPPLRRASDSARLSR